jgi:hypothetical protein
MQAAGVDCEVDMDEGVGRATSGSSSDGDAFGSTEQDYGPFHRVWLGPTQTGSMQPRRGAQQAPCTSHGRGLRGTTSVAGAAMRLYSNVSPNFNCNPRRSGRLRAGSLQGASVPVEDISATEVVRSPVGVPGVNHEENITADDMSQPPVSQARVRRACRSKKNGNWTTKQLSNAIAAHDSGMSMKKTSEQFNIPYSPFREHCYGMNSRVRGAKGVLSS